ncbi:MAG: hypothetical protein AAGE84_19015 [Cyanobacteria bacterium P01_G01_bin.39]
MINRQLKRWLLIGVSEIILSLALIAVAPTFLNSKKPMIGFVIWFTVPTVLTTSSIYAVAKLTAANQSRKIFITAFPEYSYLRAGDFLELSPAHVASQIDLLFSVKETSSIQEFNISLFEILEQTKNEKT